MRRIALASLGALAVLAAVYLFALRQSSEAPRLTMPAATALIGSGTGAVPVGPRGQILDWLPAPEDGSLPSLPPTKPPHGDRLAGTMREQALVLGAAPPTLRPHIQRSYLGRSGVDVVLRSGIELRFGDATEAGRKWRAAAAVLANPAITTLDYVDVHAPRHPAVGGSGHTLPPPP